MYIISSMNNQVKTNGAHSMEYKNVEDEIETTNEYGTSGTIEIEQRGNNISCYFLHPDPQHKINDIDSEFVANNLKPTNDKSIRLLIAETNTDTQITHTYPVILNYDSPNFLHPKYDSITTIVFKGYTLELGKSANNDADILFGLPRSIDNVFQKTLLHGLGFRQAYNFIPNIINAQNLGIQTVIFSKTDQTYILHKESKLIVSQRDLITLRQGINRISGEKGREKSDESYTFVYNAIFHKYQPETFPLRKTKRKLSVVFRQIQDADIDPVTLSQEEKKRLISSKNQIDLNYFKSAYIDFENLLKKKAKEETYQKFFTDNPLVLTVITGLPYSVFQEKAYIGGKDVSNKHGEITDFLLKHAIVPNTAIVEIKTPSTPLLNPKEYRAGVFPASKDLTGAIVQILTQRSIFAQSASIIQGRENINIYNPQGVLILGQLTELDTEEKIRSFELFRTSQKDVKIVTYDECLVLLKMVIDTLSDKNT